MSSTLALIPVFVSVFLLIASLTWLHTPLYLPLAAGWFTTAVIATSQKHPPKRLWSGTWEGVKETWFVVGLMLLVGAMTAAWGRSGTIAALAYYGLNLIRPHELAMAAFAVSSALSLLIGTSVGTLTIIGAAVMGIAHASGADVSTVAGALVSGAFVGDRSSPVSSSAQLTAAVTERRYTDNVGILVRTGLPVALVCLLLYGILDHTSGGAAGMEAIRAARNTITRDGGPVSPWMMVPPVIVILAVVIGIPIRTGMLAGIVASLLLPLFPDGSWQSGMHHNVSAEIRDTVRDILEGYRSPLFRMMSLGGVIPMAHEVALIVFAGAFYGALETTGMAGKLLHDAVSRLNTPRKLVTGAGVLSFLAALITCTQTLSILITARALRDIFDQQGVSRALLVRSIADSGVVLAGWIPWNLNAILSGVAIGVSVNTYMWHAWFLMLLPAYSFASLLLFRHAGGNGFPPPPRPRGKNQSRSQGD
jgi:NhaC family Na+:H+ antiporter